ncbi:hypothetical protein HY642_03185 [Candidatus Woesearchaeota archaeon]|nr:hypothetical protein [Candidatus Woesearchaeota archaeon]
MNKSVILAVVLGALVVISVIQAIQLSGLKGKLEAGGVTAKVTAPAQTTTQATAPQASAPSSDVKVPASVKNLPQMVGGC